MTFRANQSGSPDWDLAIKSESSNETGWETEEPTGGGYGGGDDDDDGTRKRRRRIIQFDYSNDASTDSKVVGTH